MNAFAVATARETGGTINTVAEDEIGENMALLAATTGVFGETATGVALGALVAAFLFGGLVLTLSQSSFAALLAGMAVLAALRWSLRWTALACAVRQRVSLPLGINVLRNDGHSALAVAAASGASFIRVNVLCGARVTDQGLIQDFTEADRCSACQGIGRGDHHQQLILAPINGVYGLRSISTEVVDTETIGRIFGQIDQAGEGAREVVDVQAGAAGADDPARMVTARLPQWLGGLAPWGPIAEVRAP